jgi:hypothetical protein
MLTRNIIRNVSWPLSAEYTRKTYLTEKLPAISISISLFSAKSLEVLRSNTSCQYFQQAKGVNMLLKLSIILLRGDGRERVSLSKQC